MNSKLIFLKALAVASAFVVASTNSAYAQRAHSESADTRRCTCLIFESKSSASPFATGFFLRYKTDRPGGSLEDYFITNRHVVDNRKSLLLYLSGDHPNSEAWCTLSLNPSSVVYSKRSEVDLVAVKVPLSLKVRCQMLDASVLKNDDRTLSNGSSVYTIDWTVSRIPSQANVDQEPVRKLIFRFGRVCSSDYDRWYNARESCLSEQAYVIEMITQPTWGYSGCPVFVCTEPQDMQSWQRRHRLVGIVKGRSVAFAPVRKREELTSSQRTSEYAQVNSGLVFVEPVNSLIELLQTTNASEQPGHCR